MKLKFIGTGALAAKQRSACTLVDNKILIDCGNGIIKTLLEQNVDANKIDTLLITHLHGDHFFDIPFLLKLRDFCNANNQLNIYCPIGTQNVIVNLMNIAYPDSEDWTIFTDKVRVKFIEFEELNNIEVTEGYFVDSYPVKHEELISSYGYVIRNDNKSIGFSGDSSYCDNIDKIIQESDISILDMTFIENTSEHMGIKDIEKLSVKHNKKIVTTHMSEEVRKFAKEKRINKVIIPDDGDEIII